MKTRILFTALLLLGLASWSTAHAAKQASKQATVKVCATPGMGSLAESWVKAYTNTNPDVNFEFEQLGLAEMKAGLNDENALGIVMQRPDVTMVAESMWHLTLGREIIVPVTNASNPYLEMLKTRGVTTPELAKAVAGKNATWNELLNNGSNHSLNIIVSQEPELRMAVAKFLNVELSVANNTVQSDAAILDRIQTDKYAIGFCRLSAITDAENQAFVSAVQPLPLDRNANGKIDYNENIFGKLDQLERAVWIGKYPRSLVYNIYAIAPDQPTSKSVNGFLSWIVTSGQSALIQNGYTDLAFYEKQSSLEKLNPPVVQATEQRAADYTTPAIVVIALLVLATVAVAILVRRSKRQSQKLLYDDEEDHKVLRPESIEIPNGLLYDKSHTWAFMEKDGTVKIGIDDFLQHVTGNFTGLVMKNPNEMISRNEVVASLVHEGKKINIHSPVSGRIIQRNEDLADYPSLANNSPYAWGWMYEIEPTNWVREIGFLKMAGQYRDWIKKEFIRLKDFITEVCQKKELAGELVMQEGGELPDHVLHDFEPQVWEEFQVRFIENSDIS